MDLKLLVNLSETHLELQRLDTKVVGTIESIMGVEPGKRKRGYGQMAMIAAVVYLFISTFLTTALPGIELGDGLPHTQVVKKLTGREYHAPRLKLLIDQDGVS